MIPMIYLIKMVVNKIIRLAFSLKWNEMEDINTN